MKLWNSHAWRSLAFALLIAGWGTGWLWFLLALTRPLPGILSFKQDLGALELLEVPTGLPYLAVLGAIFLLCLLPPLLLGAVRGWWDGEGRALEAMLWPLRSVKFWLSCLGWLVAGIAVAVLFHGRGPIELVVLVASVMALLATPFLCLNPTTLDAPSPARWWRPGWPGWVAVLMCVAAWTVCLAANFLLEQAIDISRIPWLTVSLSLLDELVSAFVLLLVMAIWLNRGRWRAIRSDFGQLRRSGFIVEYIWLNLTIAVILSALLVPAMVIALNSIFVIPQYESWAETSGVELPFGLRMQSGIARSHTMILFVAAVPVGLYLGFAQGRLVRQHGVGRENPAE